MEISLSPESPQINQPDPAGGIPLPRSRVVSGPRYDLRRLANARDHSPRPPAIGPDASANPMRSGGDRRRVAIGRARQTVVVAKGRALVLRPEQPAALEDRHHVVHEVDQPARPPLMCSS